MKKYLKRPGIEFLDIEGDLALIACFGQHLFIEGPWIQDLKSVLALLDKPTSLYEIKLALPGSDESNIEKAISKLSDLNFVEEVETPTEKAHDLSLPASDPLWEPFVSLFSGDPRSRTQLIQQIKSSSILHISNGGFTQEFQDLSLDFGLKPIATLAGSSEEAQIESLVKQCNTVVVSGTWFDRLAILKLNRMLFHLERPWLLLLEDDVGGSVGPFFNGKGGPCFECMWSRRISLAATSENLALLERSFFSPLGRSTHKPNMLARKILAAMAIQALAERMLGVRNFRLAKYSIDFDLLNFRTRENEVFPAPYCETCSDFLSAPHQQTISQFF